MKTIEKKTILIPSVVGKGRTELGLLSPGNFAGSMKKPISVSWGTVQYLVGHYVEKFAPAIERMDFDRLSNGDEMKALFYATLAALLETNRENVISIIVGLPVELMLNKKEAQKVLRKLRSWMSGSHEFQVNGKTYRVLVRDVNIFGQPTGGYFSWLLNDEGKITRPTSDLKALVTVCDIGFNTLDIFSIQGGEIIGKHTGGNTAGIRRAAEQLIREIKEKYGVTLSRHQADEYLRAKKPIFSCAQGDKDISPLVDQALSVASASIGDFLETLLGNGQQFRHMLFTGGGSALIKKELLQRYPLAQVLPNPVFANALGLARYARRAFPDASHVIGLDPGFGGFKAVLLSSEE
ncbi:MAG: ParM/StbA family protein [Anaerolineae bacterium]|jgi:plasmid segregation protein ParM|nr:ParM/StbA family protein [Anaerolineae bacterium]MBT7776022.1 ParM/StbA family protein [Anaerolineae bacterium]